MKKLFTTIILMLSLTASAFAQSVNAEIDGIWYSLNETRKTAIVGSQQLVVYSNNVSGDIVIPDDFDYNGEIYKVLSIGNNAFEGCSGITSVVIGNNVTSIGQTAFANCSGIVSLTIGNSVESIGAWAFQGCSSLTAVTIPNSVTSIRRSAFAALYLKTKKQP